MQLLSLLITTKTAMQVGLYMPTRFFLTPSLLLDSGNVEGKTQPLSFLVVSKAAIQSNDFRDYFAGH